jgi:hypothetical protein
VNEHVFNTVSGLYAFGGISCEIANAGLAGQIEPVPFRFFRNSYIKRF